MAALSVVQPRPGVERRSGTVDRVDSYERKMIRWRDALMDQARSELEACRDFQDAERLIDYLAGNYWDPNRPAYKSKFYDNYMMDMRRETLASLSDIRPSIDISSKVPAYEDTGHMINRYVHHVWADQELDLHLVDWIDHSLFGSGFLKHTASVPGNFFFSEHGRDHVIPVMTEGRDMQTAAAVIYRNFKPVSYFVNAFGKEKCAGLERQGISLSRSLGNDRMQRPDSISEYTWNAMSPAMKRRMALRSGPSRAAAGTATPFPVLEHLEIYSDDWSFNDHGHEVVVRNPDIPQEDHNYWYVVPPHCRLFPRKRLVVFAGDRVMYDGPATFWHGLYPFAELQLNPCVWAPGGISKYRDLIPLVRSINRVGAGVEDVVMRALNGTWFTKRGAMAPDVWDAFQPGKPGQKVMLNPMANPATDFGEKSAPQLPSQVDMWMRYVVDTIRRRSGAVDIQGLARKKQAPGGDTVAQMQDAVSGQFRLEGRYVESALRRAGYMLVSNIIQHATLDQRMRVLGGDGITWQDFDWAPGSVKPWNVPQEDAWKLMSLNIAPGSSHGNSKFQQKQTAIVLRRQGDMSLQTMYEILEMPVNVAEEIKRISSERQQGIGVAPSKGRTPRTTRSSRNGSPV